MKFKIDENLPIEYAVTLRDVGYDADTVEDERISGADDATVFAHSQAESRTLITLDLDFSNLQMYPCQSHSGIIILRTRAQDKGTLLTILRRLIPVFRERSPHRQLWIVEKDRIRVRE